MKGNDNFLNTHLKKFLQKLYDILPTATKNLKINYSIFVGLIRYGIITFKFI